MLVTKTVESSDWLIVQNLSFSFSCVVIARLDVSGLKWDCETRNLCSYVGCKTERKALQETERRTECN